MRTSHFCILICYSRLYWFYKFLQVPLTILNAYLFSFFPLVCLCKYKDAVWEQIMERDPLRSFEKAFGESNECILPTLVLWNALHLFNHFHPSYSFQTLHTFIIKPHTIKAS